MQKKNPLQCFNSKRNGDNVNMAIVELDISQISLTNRTQISHAMPIKRYGILLR